PPGPDLQDHPLRLDRVGAVLPGVAARQLVDVVAGLGAGDGLDDLAPHLAVEVGLLGVPDAHRHPGVAPDVAVLLPVHLGVDEQVLLVGVDPDRGSEERRVGKECRSRWARYPYKKKTENKDKNVRRRRNYGSTEDDDR